ncbi:cation transporter, partial [Thermodesulfobacteriota bacterium]
SKDTNDLKVKTEVAGISGPKAAPVVNNKLSKVILDVKDMSCSGCISTIKGSLTNISGIKDILVDIGSGKTEVYYDNSVLKDVSKIADAITAAGYPASMRRVVSPDQLKKEKSIADSKSRYYVASVGGWDIARTDFETELEAAKNKYSKIYGENLFSSRRGESLLENLKTQIISRMLDEGIIMQEIQRSDYKVDDKTIEEALHLHLERIGKSIEEFKDSLSEMGYNLDYFKKKFKTKLFINKYIDERVLSDASNPAEKQNLFAAWFNNSKTLCEVVYYDKDLETLIRNKSAASGCGAGG